MAFFFNKSFFWKSTNKCDVNTFCLIRTREKGFNLASNHSIHAAELKSSERTFRAVSVELQAALWENRGLKEGAALPKGEGQRPPETTAGRKGFGNKARHSSRFHHISKFLIAERDEMTRATVSNPETFNQPVPPARSSVMHSSQAHESFREERAQPAKQIREAREKEDNT